MKITETGLAGVVIVEPDIFTDGRGSFAEVFSQKEFEQKVLNRTESGLLHDGESGNEGRVVFVQENESHSRYGVVRGLHYQLPPAAQAKLVRVARGAILDVAVDIRCSSPTFGRWFSYRLDERNRHQLFIPRGFAHGFLSLAPDTVVIYKCDNYYSPAHEGSIAWNDPTIGIEWGIAPEDVILSHKDSTAPPLAEAELFD